MRWKIPSDGETRIVVKFPFVPLEIKKEYRWLEICYVKQIFKNRYEWEEEWKNLEFVSKKEDDEYIASKQEKKQ